MSETDLLAFPAEARPALARYLAGEVSAEIALMQLLLAGGRIEALLPRLRGDPRLDPVARVATAHRDGIARTVRLIEAGLAAYPVGNLAAVRDLFDRAAAHSPEAAVALYSFGVPATLERATAEIVDRLRDWRLLDPKIAALDIGCGIGRLEQALAPHLRAITGTDLSPAMVGEARRRCAGLGNVEFVCCDGDDLGGLAGRRFGLVLAVDSFPCMIAADPAVAHRHVADAARLLDPGGALAIFNYSYRGDPAADRAEIAALAAANGLVVERNGTADFELWDGLSFLLRKP